MTYSPFWEHIKEGWEVKNKEKVLFLFYEELSKVSSKAVLYLNLFILVFSFVANEFISL